MARIENAIKALVDAFVEHSNGDGKLSKDELMNMMKKEIQNPEIKAKLCSADFDKAMERMDKDRDGEINFREFMKCVCCMACRCYHKKTGMCQEDAGCR
ncbi:protein S100-B-like [Kryptolebias marmoratus]|uniref:Protein S100-B-like n=1 Tax=Kryptolebias marmoratus TaxID=37003 RepID=A0A3Q2ZXM1_KRYMA|nr:protein S100-B-like [Kryptolebias marmoratus]XP_037836477.1 protein S100-B-like [Kryptolebias marmoratus]